MYFAPTFMCDCTKVWIVGDKKARISTIIAGIWGDLMICVVATFIWWGTATGMWIHDFAYKVMMVTGIGVTILNLNPLIKLDGYYLLSELINETGLKEESTVYVSSWVRKHIFRLPAEVAYVPRHRRVLYIVYSVLSGVYSYLLIAVVVVFIYHILINYTPEWAWLPALLLGLRLFKSRIVMLERFMRNVYLDKKERVLAWFTPDSLRVPEPRVAQRCPETKPVVVDGRFALEPLRRTLVHTQVPGTVTEIFSDEGQPVAAGGPLLRLRNLELESAAALAGADLRNASARALRAGITYENFGPAEHERQQSTVRQAKRGGGRSNFSEVTSPIGGIVTTHPVTRSAERLPEIRYRIAGWPICPLEGLHLHSGIQHAGCSPGGPGETHAESQFQPWSGTLASLAARLLPDRDRADREGSTGRHSGSQILCR